MAIRIYKPNTPGTRNRGVSSFNEITKGKPEKSLTVSNHRVKGRNNQGRITIRHRGGGQLGVRTGAKTKSPRVQPRGGGHGPPANSRIPKLPNVRVIT